MNQFSSVQDGIYALGKAHNYTLHSFCAAIGRLQQFALHTFLERVVFSTRVACRLVTATQRYMTWLFFSLTEIQIQIQILYSPSFTTRKVSRKR